MKYWAFAANPLTYRIEDAVRELEFDYWTTRNSKEGRDRTMARATLGRGLAVSAFRRYVPV